VIFKKDLFTKAEEKPEHESTKERKSTKTILSTGISCAFWAERFFKPFYRWNDLKNRFTTKQQNGFSNRFIA